jgi:uncharacterized protein (DUF1786 family)
MKILTVDVGTGTQDIYLYNSSLGMENNFKLVVPSPTMIIRKQIQVATKGRLPILLSGVTMGGGPSTWAAEDHLKAGLQVYATPEAARTFDDDLIKVEQMGVRVVSEDEADKLPKGVMRLQLRDFYFHAITSAFQSFGVDISGLAAVVVGVFDHGNAPANVSDRQFRFSYLDERIRAENRLSAFAYRGEEVPLSMTRLKSVVDSGRDLDCPLVVMDTAPAAVLGATLDRKVGAKEQVMIANIGNFHTLAFRLGKNGIEGLFEHHTGFVDVHKLNKLLNRLAQGTIQMEDVFNDEGHGALMYDSTPHLTGVGEFDVAITGPRRNLYDPGKASLRPYFPAPYGDMMITGCFGLLAATADVIPELAGPIRASLYKDEAKSAAPWDAD